MKYSWLVCFLFAGCVYSDVDHISSIDNLSRLHSVDNVHNVQINSVPMPFFISHAYVVWVDGKRIPMNRSQITTLAKSLDLPLEPAPNTQHFHSGDGWVRPLQLSNYKQAIHDQ